MKKKFNIKYGIIAYEKDKNNEDIIWIRHFCAYEEPITDFVIKDLEKELNTDEEFGLVGRINKDIFLIKASKDIVKIYKDECGNNLEYDQ